MKPLSHLAGKNGKSRKLIGVNLAVLALMLVNSGFTLTACQQLPGGKSTDKLKEEPPAKSDQKTSDQNKGKEQDTQVDDDPE